MKTHKNTFSILTVGGWVCIRQTNNLYIVWFNCLYKAGFLLPFHPVFSCNVKRGHSRKFDQLILFISKIIWNRTDQKTSTWSLEEGQLVSKWLWTRRGSNLSNDAEHCITCSSSSFHIHHISSLLSSLHCN